MTDFLAEATTLDANWRAVVLFGRNVASYKFALAKALLGMADRADDRVPLEELAAPFARHLCEHLARVDKQTTSRSSRFLDACRAFNRGELAEDKLVTTTARLGFTNVIDAFHVVGAGPVPVRFFADERTALRAQAIRITDDLRRLAASLQGAGLADEAEARWRLVETAWALDLPRAGVAVQADTERNLLFVERVRRVDLTGVRAALNGYQRGRCFYCRAETPLAAADVDHFFPWVLKERGAMPDADGVWNLVLACRRCNRGERGKFAAVPAARLVARLHERNRPAPTPRPGPPSCGRGSGPRSTRWCTSGSRRRPTAMSDPLADTIAWYDRQAANFAARTACLDLGPLYERFLSRVRPGGRILDAGCGVGRDALAFAERGFEVIAFDASGEMARLARERVGGRAEVLRMRFEDVAWREEFDGVWACASLLHVPATELPAVARRLAAALQPGGALYISFKHGTGERVAGGRRFTDHNEQTLRAALGGTGLALAEIWTTTDVRAGRSGERWLNAVATRLGQQQSQR